MPGASARFALSGLAALMLLAACGPQAPEAPGAEAPAAPHAGVPRPVDRVRAYGSADTAAALAPFGLLRIAPASSREVVLGHGRRADGPDLLIAAATTPDPDQATDRERAAGLGESESRWSSTPGRLVGMRTDAGLVVEATTSGRVALYRFSVTPGDTLVLAFGWRGASSGEFSPARGRRALTGNLTTPDGPQLHAAVRFDTDFSAIGDADTGNRLQLAFTPPDGLVHVRVALSTVDLAAARDNLLELDHWNFERAHGAVRDRWDQWLGRLSVAGDGVAEDALRGAWFRVLAHYGDLADRDGRFRAADGSVRRVPGGRPFIGNLEIEREAATVIPLLTLMAPDVAAGLADSLLLHHRLEGRFPVATGWGVELSPDAPRGGVDAAALAVLAGVAIRDLQGRDAQRVLPAMLKAAGPLGERSLGRGLASLGFFAYDEVAGPTVTLTLEASIAQYALAAVAAELGNRAIASEAAVRSVVYRQLFDPQAGFFRARSSAMNWRSPFDPEAPSPEVRADYRDGHPWTALWMPAQYDIDGLLTLLGGRRELAVRLDGYFSRSGATDSPGTGATPESSLLRSHVPWLYAFSNRPGAGQPLIDRRLSHVAEPGAESAAEAAWRVFASLGLYPLSLISGEYVLSRPVVAGAALQLAEEALFIEVDSASASGAVATLDGVPLTGPTVSHRRLVAGGRLVAPGGD